LKEKRFKIGLVTQYSRATASQILAKVRIATFFDTIVGFEDSDEQKPSPKPVLIALNRLDSRSENAVFVGDMKQDIIAGHNAGVRTVGVFRGKDAYHTREVLREANPGSIVENLNELTKLIL
jgi:pyrophosphatase PpaX